MVANRSVQAATSPSTGQTTSLPLCRPTDGGNRYGRARSTIIVPPVAAVPPTQRGTTRRPGRNTSPPTPILEGNLLGILFRTTRSRLYAGWRHLESDDRSGLILSVVDSYPASPAHVTLLLSTASVDTSAGAASGACQGRLLPELLPDFQFRPKTSSATASASIVT